MREEGSLYSRTVKTLLNDISSLGSIYIRVSRAHRHCLSGEKQQRREPESDIGRAGVDTHSQDNRSVLSMEAHFVFRIETWLGLDD